MTPEEKAKELYNKFNEALNINDMRIGANPFVIMCCLITANDHIQHGTPNPYTKHGIEQRHYWQEVKEAIEKLSKAW